MARGPSAKNTREGRRTYPCGSIPLLPAIVLPRLAPLLMISPSNRKSDDTSIDHLFCLCRRVGYFGPISGESAGVAEFVPDDFHTHPYRRYRATVSDSGADGLAGGRRRVRYCFGLREPTRTDFSPVPQQGTRRRGWPYRQAPSVFEHVGIGDDSDVAAVIRVGVNIIVGVEIVNVGGNVAGIAEDSCRRATAVPGWRGCPGPTVSAGSTGYR